MSPRFPHHYALLDHVHATLGPSTYVEIGVDAGLSLRSVRPGTTVVGIDPVLSDEVVEANPTAVLVESTSDAFFARHDLTDVLGGRPVDLAFVDGMHRFEQVLSDLANLQPHCHDHSVILIHDCLPTDQACASRRRTTVSWAGDVWRAAHALATERPDEPFVTLDVAPTGMGVAPAFGRRAPLAPWIDRWTERYRSIDFATFDRDRDVAVNRRVATAGLVDRLLAPVPDRPDP